MLLKSKTLVVQLLTINHASDTCQKEKVTRDNIKVRRHATGNHTRPLERLERNVPLQEVENITQVLTNAHLKT